MSTPLPAIAWHLLTRLGEAQILLPLVAAAALYLWRQGRERRLVLRWAACLGLAALVTMLSKLAFMGWGWGSARWDFTGISGHAMFSAACLPVLAWLLTLGRKKPVHRAATLGGFALAALVAYSRLVVHAHSVSEVAAGFALGVLASVLVLRPRASADLVLPIWLPAAVVASLLMLPLAAPRSRSHQWMEQLSLQVSGHARVHRRQDLHRGTVPATPAGVAGPA